MRRAVIYLSSNYENYRPFFHSHSNKVIKTTKKELGISDDPFLANSLSKCPLFHSSELEKLDNKNQTAKTEKLETMLLRKSGKFKKKIGKIVKTKFSSNAPNVGFERFNVLKYTNENFKSSLQLHKKKTTAITSSAFLVKYYEVAKLFLSRKIDLKIYGKNSRRINEKYHNDLVSFFKKLIRVRLIKYRV